MFKTYCTLRSIYLLLGFFVLLDTYKIRFRLLLHLSTSLYTNLFFTILHYNWLTLFESFQTIRYRKRHKIPKSLFPVRKEDPSLSWVNPTPTMKSTLNTERSPFFPISLKVKDIVRSPLSLHPLKVFWKEDTKRIKGSRVLWVIRYYRIKPHSWRLGVVLVGVKLGKL